MLSWASVAKIKTEQKFERVIPAFITTGRDHRHAVYVVWGYPVTQSEPILRGLSDLLMTQTFFYVLYK